MRYSLNSRNCQRSSILLRHMPHLHRSMLVKMIRDREYESAAISTFRARELNEGIADYPLGGLTVEDKIKAKYLRQLKTVEKYSLFSITVFSSRRISGKVS